MCTGPLLGGKGPGDEAIASTERMGEGSSITFRAWVLRFEPGAIYTFSLCERSKVQRLGQKLDG